MRWPRLVALLAFGFVLVLTGCGSSSGSNGSPIVAASVPDLLPGEPLISYSKVGGPPTAFVDTKLKVEQDNTYTLEQYHAKTVTGKLTESELAALKRVFADAHFDSAPSDLSRQSTNIDEPNYDIRYINHSVTILHGAVSATLQPVVAAFDAFVASHASG